MQKLVRGKSDTNFFVDKHNIDNIHLNLRTIKSFTKQNPMITVSRKSSKKFETHKLKSSTSIFEVYSQKLSSSSGICKSQSDKLEENFFQFLKSVLIFKRDFDREIFETQVEGKKLYINILLENIRVMLYNFKTKCLLNSLDKPSLVVSESSAQNNQTTRQGLIESFEKFDRIIEILIKFTPHELFREVKSIILNEFQQTKIEIQDYLKKYKKDASSKFFISMSQTILFILSKVSYRLDYYTLTLNSLAEKLKRFFLEFLEGTNDLKDSQCSHARMRSTLKALDIFEKFLRYSKEFAKEYYGNAKGGCCFNKFSSFGLYIFDKLLKIIICTDEPGVNRTTSTKNIYSRRSVGSIKWSIDEKENEKDKLYWKGYLHKTSKSNFKLDKFFRLYFNSRLVGWKYNAFQTENASQKLEICRICESSIPIREYILHIYYCKDQKVFYQTILELRNCMALSIEDLRKYRDKMTRQSKEPKDKIFSPNSPLSIKWSKFGVSDKTPVMFLTKLTSFGKDKSNNNNNNEGLIDTLIWTLTTISKENELKNEFYENNPHKLTQLMSILHFTFYLYLLNKNSLPYSEELNEIFCNLFSCLMRKVMAIEDILTLQESKNKSNMKSEEIVIEEKRNNSKQIEDFTFVTPVIINSKGPISGISGIHARDKVEKQMPRQNVVKPLDFSKLLESMSGHKDKDKDKDINRHNIQGSSLKNKSNTLIALFNTSFGSPRTSQAANVSLPSFSDEPVYSPRVSTVKEISKGLKNIIDEPKIPSVSFTVAHKESTEFKDNGSNKNTSYWTNDNNSTPLGMINKMPSNEDPNDDSPLSPSNVSPTISSDYGKNKNKICPFPNKKSLFGQNIVKLNIKESEKSFEENDDNDNDNDNDNQEVLEEEQIEDVNYFEEDDCAGPEADSQLEEFDELINEIRCEEVNENENIFQRATSAQDVNNNNNNNNTRLVMDIIDDTINESSSSSSKYSATKVCRMIPKLSMTKTPTKITDFQFIKRIGEGGYGQVDLCRKITTGDLFAIKSVDINLMRDKNFGGLLKSETMILNEINSDYVVKCYYIFSDSINFYFVMEYCQGGDLYGLLNSIVLSHKTIQLIVAEVVRALEYLHSKGIIHRDIKPENIVINKEGHFKLTDFGISESGLKTSKYAILFGEDKFSELNIPGSSHQLLGTGNYMAPEIFKDDTPLTHAVDFWALGVLIYELFTFKVPFLADSPTQIRENILNLAINWTYFDSDELKEIYSPSNLDDAKDLIKKFLVMDSSERWGEHNLEQIKAHKFFTGFNWTVIKDIRDIDVLRHVKARMDKTNEDMGKLVPKTVNRSQSIDNSSNKSENENDVTMEMDSNFYSERVDNLYFKSLEVLKMKIKQKELGINTESNCFMNFEL